MAGRQILETDRLILREFVEEDAEAFYPIGTDPEVVRWTRQPLDSVEHSRQILLTRSIADYAKHGFGRWACVIKETGEMIGFVGLKFLEESREVDIGYRLLSKHWGKGYATEANRPCIDYGFRELKLDQIIGLVLPDNVASIRVLTKLGLTDVGTMEHFGLTHRRMELQRADWERRLTSPPLQSSGSP